MILLLITTNFFTVSVILFSPFLTNILTVFYQQFSRFFLTIFLLQINLICN